MDSAFDVITRGFANDTAANQASSQQRIALAMQNFQRAAQLEAEVAAEGRRYNQQMDVLSMQARYNSEAQRKAQENAIKLEGMREDAAATRNNASLDAAAAREKARYDALDKRDDDKADRASEAAAESVAALYRRTKEMRDSATGAYADLDKKARTPELALAATKDLATKGLITPAQATVLAGLAKQGKLDEYERMTEQFAKSAAGWYTSDNDENTMAAIRDTLPSLVEARKAELKAQADRNFLLTDSEIRDAEKLAAEQSKYILPKHRKVVDDVLNMGAPKDVGSEQSTKPKTEADAFNQFGSGAATPTPAPAPAANVLTAPKAQAFVAPPAGAAYSVPTSIYAPGSDAYMQAMAWNNAQRNQPAQVSTPQPPGILTNIGRNLGLLQMPEYRVAQQ